MKNKDLLRISLLSLLMLAAGWFLNDRFGKEGGSSEVDAGASAANFRSVSSFSSSGDDAPVLDRKRSERKRVRKEKDEPVTKMQVNPDGSVTIPEELVERISARTVDHEFNLNVEELTKLGCSEFEIQELDRLVKTLQAENVRKESKATIVSQDENEVVLRVPNDGSNSEHNQAAFFEEIQSIVGDRAPVVTNSLRHPLSVVTGDWGARERVIKIQRDENGRYSYEMLNITQERLESLPETGNSFEDFRKVSSLMIGNRYEKLPEHLAHWFE